VQSAIMDKNAPCAARSMYNYFYARQIASSEVLAPPTISTSGIRCGGLNGWAMIQRSACDAAPN